MHCDYLNPAIRQLRDQQVRFAPREKRIEQAAQAERLLRELDPARTYPYEYICYRVTNYRPESYPDLRLSGQEASHDLRLFVEDVSDSAGVAAEAAGERVLTVEELARQFNVSTKTISRWRRHGLISRRFVIGGRKRVGFLQSSVERFVEQNRERVARGAQFSQLTPEERTMIHRAGPPPGPRRRRTGRRHQAAGPQDRPQHRDHPLHAPPVRPRPPRRRRVSRQSRAAATGGQAQDLPAVPARRIGRGPGRPLPPHPHQHLPHHRRDAGPADHGTAAGLHPQRRLSREVRSQQARRAGRSDRCRSPSCRRRSRGSPAACLPTWPASTRCRC